MRSYRNVIWLAVGLVLMGAQGTGDGCGEGPIDYAVVPDPQSQTGQHILTLDITTPDIVRDQASGELERPGAPPVEIARPLGSAPPRGWPGLVFVHGGHWRTGSLYSHRYPNWTQQAASRGYVAITVNYRLTDQDDHDDPEEARGPRFPWPAQIQDVKCAIRWLKAHAGDYDVDASRIGVIGYSAGGHLTLMSGLARGVERFEGAYCPHVRDAQGNPIHSDVAAVVAFSGVGEVEGVWSKVGRPRDSIRRLLDRGPDFNPADDPQRVWDMSPTHYVDARFGDTPVLLLHGRDDNTVPIESARMLDAALGADNALRPVEERREHALIEYRGVGHGWSGAAEQDAYARSWAFFDRHLKGDAEAQVGCSPWPDCEAVR